MAEPKRVLLVDDDEAIREVVEMVLSAEGHAVLTAPHGAAALDLLQQIRPDVILLDMKMPVMDGWEFARVYRGRPDPRAPVVVVTAAQDAARRAAEIDAEGYLAKPFDVDDLIQVVSRWT